MSNKQLTLLTLLTGGGQLLLALFYFLGIDIKFIQKLVAPMSFHDGLMSILIIGGLIFVCIGLYRTRGPQNIINPTNIEENIRKWAAYFGYGCSPISDPEVDFALDISLPTGKHILAIRSKKLDKYIVIQGAVGISPNHLAALARMEVSEQNRVMNELIIEMARFKIGFVGGGEPIKTITLSKQLPITNMLTEHIFIEAVNEIELAQILVIGIIRKNLGQ